MDQRDMTNIDALLTQLRRAKAKEAQAAEIFLKEGDEMTAQRRWGAAGKGYIGVIISKPSAVALMGYAHTRVMSEIRPDNPTILEAKTKDFQYAANIYRLALEFAERADSPLAPEDRTRVEERIRCLDDFVRNPDPQASTTCGYVRDALKVSGIE